MLKITRVSYRLPRPELREEGLLAFCVVVLEDSLMLHDIAIRDGAKGVFVSFPHRKMSEQSVRSHRETKGLTADLFHPVNKDYHDYFKRTLLRGYESDQGSLVWYYVPELVH